MKEKDLVKEIKKFILKKHPDSYIIKNSGGQFRLRGVPDLVCCINGIFIGIEIKVDKNKPTKLQWFHLERIRKAGGISFWVNEKDWRNILNKKWFFDLANGEME